MITAEQVREELKRQELTQKQLAGKAKVSSAVISQWLSGKAEPSDISKARIALALGIAEPGELDDQQVGAALAAPDDLYETDEDAAAAEILGILGESTAPAPAAADTDVAHTAPAPEPRPDPREVSPAELLYLLTRLPGCYIYEERDGDYSVALPRASALERFARNLAALDAMLQAGDIDADAHLIAAASLLGAYKRREAEEDG